MQQNGASDTCVRPREWHVELSLGTPSRFTWEEHVSFGCLYPPRLSDGAITTWTTTTAVQSSRVEPWNLRNFYSTLDIDHFRNVFPSSIVDHRTRSKMPVRSKHDLDM